MSISAYEIVGLDQFGEERVVVGVCFIESVSGRLLDIHPSAFTDACMAECFIDWALARGSLDLRNSNACDLEVAVRLFNESYRGVECPDCGGENTHDVLPSRTDLLCVDCQGAA